LLTKPITRALVLAGACLLAITPFFWRGVPSGHDFEFHIFSWMEVLGQWKHGIAYPRWAALAHWGYGEARFLFYPPASWTLGALLGAVLPWKMVPGAYCWLVLTLAGASMYRLARPWLPVPDALFAAVFYALNPYHLLIVYWRSAYAELLAAPLLPLVLLCLLQLNKPGSTQDGLSRSGSSQSGLHQSGLRPTLQLALILAAAWLTNAPAALMIHYSTAGLALLFFVHKVVRELAHKRSLDPQILRPLIQTAFAMLLGAGLASFYLLPAIYEQRWINLSEVLAPGVRPQDNFLFTTLADPSHNRFNLLVSTAALAEIGVLALAIWPSRRKNRGDHVPWMPLAAWSVISAALMFSLSNPLWQHLPKLRFVQLPFRWLLCMNAALAVLLAMATKRWTSRVLVSTVLLSALIIAGYRFQPPWWEKSGDFQQMSAALANGTGYEGTDEYVPAGADPYDLNKSLPRVTDDKGAPVTNEMLAWGETQKRFTIHAAAPQNITVRLFSYPAWEVLVNGELTETEQTDDTGLMVIPVGARDSDVQIYFRRTSDRFVGNLVSLISLLVFAAVWMKTQPRTLPSRQV
jgi:hypothetical protein